MAEFSKPQRGQTRSEASSQASTPALSAARPPKMAKVTRPDPTVSSRATVNRALPSAEAAKRDPNRGQGRPQRRRTPSRAGSEDLHGSPLPGRRSDGEPDALSLAWIRWACTRTGGGMAGPNGSRTQWRELFHEVVETNLCLAARPA